MVGKAACRSGLSSCGHVRGIEGGAPRQKAAADEDLDEAYAAYFRLLRKVSRQSWERRGLSVDYPPTRSSFPYDSDPEESEEESRDPYLHPPPDDGTGVWQ